VLPTRSRFKQGSRGVGGVLPGCSTAARVGATPPFRCALVSGEVEPFSGRGSFGSVLRSRPNNKSPSEGGDNGPIFVPSLQLVQILLGQGMRLCARPRVRRCGGGTRSTVSTAFRLV